jgi:hypothetical protein
LLHVFLLDATGPGKRGLSAAAGSGLNKLDKLAKTCIPRRTVLHKSLFFLYAAGYK